MIERPSPETSNEFPTSDNQFPGWWPPTTFRVQGNPMSKEDTEELLRAARLGPAMPDTAAEQPMTAKPLGAVPYKDLQRMYREIVNQMAEDLRKVGAGGDSRIPEDMAEDLIALGWEKRE